MSYAFWIALVIAVSGGCLGEWQRLRRGWASGIGPSYEYSAVLCAMIVSGNSALADVRATELPFSQSSLAIVLVVGGGSLLYATAWVIVVTSWDCFQQSRVKSHARHKNRN